LDHGGDEAQKKLMHREESSGRVQTTMTRYGRTTKWRYEWLEQQRRSLKRDEIMVKKMVAWGYEKREELALKKTTEEENMKIVEEGGKKKKNKKKRKKKKKRKLGEGPRSSDTAQYFDNINTILKKKPKRSVGNGHVIQNYEVVFPLRDQSKRQMKVTPTSSNGKMTRQNRKFQRLGRKLTKTLPSHPSIPPSQVGADAEAQWAEIRENNIRMDAEREYIRRYGMR
jgi:hypothetical protein